MPTHIVLLTKCHIIWLFNSFCIYFYLTKSALPSYTCSCKTNTASVYSYRLPSLFVSLIDSCPPQQQPILIKCPVYSCHLLTAVLHNSSLFLSSAQFIRVTYWRLSSTTAAYSYQVPSLFVSLIDSCRPQNQPILIQWPVCSCHLLTAVVHKISLFLSSDQFVRVTYWQLSSSQW